MRTDVVNLPESRRSIADKAFTGALTDKWKDLLEGVQGDHVRRSTAVLLENEMSFLNNLTEETRAAQTGPFTKFIFPLIRRVYPNLIANNIVSVQPMTSPVGAIFFFRYRYGTTKGATTAGTEMIPQPTFDRFYGSESVFSESIGVGDAVLVTFTTVLDFTPVRLPGLAITAGAVVGTADAAGTITGAGVVSGSVNPNTGAVTITYTVAPAAAVQVLANYQYNSELNPSVPQVNLDVELITVTVLNRKLKALWSSEAADDLRALHGMDIETELVAGIASELATEIDREILDDLLQGALTGVPGLFAPSFDSFNRPAPAGVSDFEHIRGIIIPISNVSNKIHKNTLRAPANWIVCSPEIASVLDSLPFFQAVDPAQYTYTGTIVKIGTLQTKWTVYKDPYFVKDRMLVGYQGPSFLDTGYVWAPYIPLQVTPTFLDPADFTLRKGLRTRYGKKLVRAEFYGTVQVTNLP